MRNAIWWAEGRGLRGRMSGERRDRERSKREKLSHQIDVLLLL